MYTPMSYSEWESPEEALWVVGSITVALRPPPGKDQSHKVRRVSLLTSPLCFPASQDGVTFEQKKMPYLTLIASQIAAQHKSAFLSAWPAIAARLNANPTVLGISAGEVLLGNGKPATEFKFVQTMGTYFLHSPLSPLHSLTPHPVFATAQDQATFHLSPVVLEMKAIFSIDSGSSPSLAETFHIPSLPASSKLAPYHQISRIVVKDSSQQEEARDAWGELMRALGKDAGTFGEGGERGDGRWEWEAMGMGGWGLRFVGGKVWSGGRRQCGGWARGRRLSGIGRLGR